MGSISTAVNSESCRRCADRERTDADQTSCIVKPIQYLQWTDPFSIAISICAVLGFVAVVVCFGTYVRYRHTPTIKATSTELSYILLTAITTTLVCIFLYLSKPTDLMCNLQVFYCFPFSSRYSLSLPPSLCLSLARYLPSFLCPTVQAYGIMFNLGPGTTKQPKTHMV